MPWEKGKFTLPIMHSARVICNKLDINLTNKMENKDHKQLLLANDVITYIVNESGLPMMA
jgi:hypothetical protein